MTEPRPNLEKVANLSEPEWQALWSGVKLLNAYTPEANFPPHLHAQTWRLMRQCGAKVQSYGTMRLVAWSLGYNRLLIERLRNW